MGSFYEVIPVQNSIDARLDVVEGGGNFFLEAWHSLTFCRVYQC